MEYFSTQIISEPDHTDSVLNFGSEGVLQALCCMILAGLVAWLFVALIETGYFDSLRVWCGMEPAYVGRPSSTVSLIRSFKGTRIVIFRIDVKAKYCIGGP